MKTPGTGKFLTIWKQLTRGSGRSLMSQDDRSPRPPQTRSLRPSSASVKHELPSGRTMTDEQLIQWVAKVGKSYAETFPNGAGRDAIEREVMDVTAFLRHRLTQTSPQVRSSILLSQDDD